MRIKIPIIVFLVIIFLVFSLVVLGDNEEQCVGGGDWITPTNIDLREGDTSQSYCKCQRGFRWNNTSCEEIPDKILCETSDGQWIENECVCPNNSIGWLESFGCNYVQTPHEVKSVDKEKSNLFKISSIIIILLFFVFILIRIYLNRKRSIKNG